MDRASVFLYMDLKTEQIFEISVDKQMFGIYNKVIEQTFGTDIRGGYLHMRSERAQQRKYKRDRIRRTKQIIERVLLTICLIALLAIRSSRILTKATTAEEAKNVYYKYYTQIEIQAGDSLWDIAGSYMAYGPYDSRNDYMEEVVEINQLSDTTIIAGQHLIVPYYESNYK